jgi:hypothetical protein
MRASQRQYNIAVKIYEKAGADGVYQFANAVGINEWNECQPCETETPDTHDFCCLVCGSSKQKFRVIPAYICVPLDDTKFTAQSIIQDTLAKHGVVIALPEDIRDRVSPAPPYTKEYFDTLPACSASDFLRKYEEA